MSEFIDSFLFFSLRKLSKLASVKIVSLFLPFSNLFLTLFSIKFNDSVIELYVGTENVNLKEEAYDFYTPKKKGGNFIDYINKYDEYESSDEIQDENNIGNEGNE